jgi:hypothetical protein
MIQMAIFSQVKIQSGKADLLILVVVALGLQPEIPKVDNILFSLFAGTLVGFISAEPFWIVVIIYFFALYFSLILKERLPQIPILSMFFCSIVFMALHLGIQAVYFQFLGFDIDLQTTFNSLILPSLMVFPSLEEL